MANLSMVDKQFFKDNGYLIKRSVLSCDQVEAARNSLWEGIDADRDDPSTWVGAGPRVLHVQEVTLQ